MKTLKLSTIAENGERPIKVGYKAENEVSEIIFDDTKWRNEFGAGTLVLSVQRNGDAQPYPVELQNKTWLITDTDLAHEGEGRFQVSYIVGEQVKRSAIFSFYVKDSMAVNGEEPDPYESWLDRIEEIAQNVTPVVTVSKEDNVATITVQQFEEDPQVVHVYDGTNGKDGQDGKDGKDGADGKDGKDGVDGKDGKDGATGATPNITIGNVETLPAGSQATASIRGTAEDPIIDFGLVQGEAGADGKDGKDGADGKDGKDGTNGTNGQDGASAGFGTVTATVDANTGTPSVDVSTSGSDTAKNFAFAFHNLKGDKGDAGDVNSNGIYPNLSAGNITGDFHIDTAPYLLRQTAGGASHIGGKAFDTLVGGSVAVNQLFNKGDYRDNGFSDHGIGVTNNGDGSIILNGTLSDNNYIELTKNAVNISFIQGHKYLFLLPTAPTNTSLLVLYGTALGNASLTGSTIKNGLATVTERIYPRFTDASRSVTLTNFKYYLSVIDLTQLFASDPSIADRAYTLEQNTAGSGIAWLKSYGYIRDSYIPYNAGTLQSVKTTAHITRDADDTIVGNYPLDDIELRGVAKLVNNEIKYDGDVYEADGTVTRKYGYRAYEAGDESLANAITDGTHTVYKLNTPTTETADPFTSPQQVFTDGTEEYLDTRTVPIPVGHETKYELDLASKLIGLPWDMSMIAPVEVEYKATRNYTTGQLFIVDNILYKATANIANGGTITPNTNCSATTLAEVISTL